MIEQTRKSGPTLVVDSGNALFKTTGAKDADARAKAQFILRTMGALGTEAMAAGARDLVLGSAWLKAEAAKAKVTVLSVNLVDGAGKPVFAPSKIVEVGGKKIALIGVSPAGPVVGDAAVKGGPVVAPTLAEARKLRSKADLVVVLAAVPYADSLQLSRELGGAVDLVLQSHESRGEGIAQRIEGNYLLSSGERGRMVGRAELDLASKGQLFDAAEIDRNKRTLEILAQQTRTVKERLEKAQDASAKQSLQKTLASFEARKKDVEQQIALGGKASGRRMKLDYPALTSAFPSDPTLAAEAQRLDPLASQGH